jgi:hypothetical protein
LPFTSILSSVNVSEYPFLKGQNIKNEGILYRDLLILDIENATKNNEKWNPTV